MSSLIRRLATLRVAGSPLVVRYDSQRQVSDVFEDGRWVASWQSSALQQTKKCDIETGEDQRGH